MSWQSNSRHLPFFTITTWQRLSPIPLHILRAFVFSQHQPIDVKPGPLPGANYQGHEEDGSCVPNTTDIHASVEDAVPEMRAVLLSGIQFPNWSTFVQHSEASSTLIMEDVVVVDPQKMIDRRKDISR